MASTVSRIYSNFRGVDFRGEEINLVRSPDALNMWKDYKETESIRTRPGLKLRAPSSFPVYGIYEYNGALIVHSGTVLQRRTTTEVATIYAKMAQNPSQAFVYNGIFYIKDGTNYLQYDGTEVKAVVGFIPTTTIARKPMGGGTKHQDVNMLSDYRINTFLATGADFDFYLDVINIDEDYVPIVKVDGEEVATTEYMVDYAEGKITFITSPPDSPETDGQDNVWIQFKKAVPKYKKCILESTLLQVFDNRVFVSGNPDYPNWIWHCSLNDPSYFSDLDYYQEGKDTAAVKGMVAGNNALWVFREPSDANTTVFYHTPTIDEEYGKIYPNSHSTISTGCIGKAINFNDDIVFFSERGMEGISGDIMTEQVVAHRSSLVDRKLTAEPDYKNMILAEWEGYLLVIIGNKVYLADSRAMFQNENHVEYEWFYWELSKNITCSCVVDGVLYLGADDGVYMLTDLNANIDSYWTTPKDKFSNPHKFKTSSKKSCTVEAEGKEISVYFKTNKGNEYNLLNTYEEVTDAFNCRVKAKKFKDLQLKFSSPRRFSLETATLECFIGGYLKNL